MWENIIRKQRKMTADNYCLVMVLGKFDIYNICKNTINKDFSLLRKVDYARYISWSRISLIEELELYLYSVIHPDTLNFVSYDKLTNDYLNGKEWYLVKKHSLLVSAIRLDGFCMSMEKMFSLIEDQNVLLDDYCCYDFDEDIDDVIMDTEEESNQISKYEREVYKIYLPSLIFFERFNRNYRVNKGEKEKISRERYIKAFIKNEPVFVNKNLAKSKCDALRNTFIEWNRKKSNSDSKLLLNAVNLYLINKYTHIIDMITMNKYKEATTRPYHFKGLYTQTVLCEIFDSNRREIRVEFDEIKYKEADGFFYSEHIRTYAASENIFEKHFHVRDIDFINSLIERYADSFADYFNTKPANHNSKFKDTVFDFEKVITNFRGLSEDMKGENIFDVLPDENDIDSVSFSKSYTEISQYIKSLEGKEE